MNKARIFVVEDEALIAMELKDRVEEMGHAVCGVAGRSDIALRGIGEQLPDLVLMDIRIAGPASGIEVAERVQNNYGIPVIFITAYSNSDLFHKASKIEPYGYLVKPFNEDDLKSAIDVALARPKPQKKG